MNAMKSQFRLEKLLCLVILQSLLLNGCAEDDDTLAPESRVEEPMNLGSEEESSDNENEEESEDAQTDEEEGEDAQTDEEEDATQSTDDGSSPDATENDTEEAELLSIAATATANPELSTLVEAATATDLVEILSKDEGTYTVFAPTNAAFDALPEGTLEGLLEDTETLLQILLYHALPEVVLEEALATKQFVQSLTQLEISVEVVDNGVVLNGTAAVTSTDILCSNGVIHIIDAVLLPPTTEEEGGEATEEEGGEDTEEEGGEATEEEGGEATEEEGGEATEEEGGEATEEEGGEATEEGGEATVVEGCTNEDAENFDSEATIDNGTCTFVVTFQLETGCSDIDTAAGVFFNSADTGWCGDCDPMTFDSESGVWTYQASITEGEFEYKYRIGSTWETLDATEDAACTTVTADGQFTNRILIVTEETIVAPVAFGSCDSCPVSSEEGGG